MGKKGKRKKNKQINYGVQNPFYGSPIVRYPASGEAGTPIYRYATASVSSPRTKERKELNDEELAKYIAETSAAKTRRRSQQESLKKDAEKARAGIFNRVNTNVARGATVFHRLVAMVSYRYEPLPRNSVRLAGTILGITDGREMGAPAAMSVVGNAYELKQQVGYNLDLPSMASMWGENLLEKTLQADRSLSSLPKGICLIDAVASSGPKTKSPVLWPLTEGEDMVFIDSDDEFIDSGDKKNGP